MYKSGSSYDPGTCSLPKCTAETNCHGPTSFSDRRSAPLLQRQKIVPFGCCHGAGLLHPVPLGVSI